MSVIEEIDAEIERLRAALFDMFCTAEELAVNTYATWGGGEWVFDEFIWEVEDPDVYEKAAAAREILGLKAFSYRGRSHPKAPARELADKRAKEPRA